jgi:hypothetical protein
MNSAMGDTGRPVTRFRIQKSPDQRLFANSPELIAGCHVFRRLSIPRHPPYTLSSLTTFIDHRLTLQRHSRERKPTQRRFPNQTTTTNCIVALSSGRARKGTKINNVSIGTIWSRPFAKKGTRRLLSEMNHPAL